MLVCKGKKSISVIKIWRDEFQSRVNKLSGNQYLQFTRELWIPNANTSRNKQYDVSEITSKTFPYLNLKFFWNADGEL